MTTVTDTDVLNRVGNTPLVNLDSLSHDNVKYFAKLEGINAIRSGFGQIVKNEVPIYEIISGAALAFAALLLIIPGFLTDLIGFLLIIPVTRKLFIRSFSSKFYKKEKDNNTIEGEFEIVDEDKERDD